MPAHNCKQTFLVKLALGKKSSRWQLVTSSYVAGASTAASSDSVLGTHYVRRRRMTLGVYTERAHSNPHRAGGARISECVAATAEAKAAATRTGAALQHPHSSRSS